jgi:hypothetical protein
MTYEETPISGKVSKHAVKKEAGKVLDNFSTSRILTKFTSAFTITLRSKDNDNRL